MDDPRLAWHIYGISESGAFYLVLQCRSPRAWTAAKRRLAFCRVVQNGEDEGVLRLDRPPDVDEAKKIRSLLGIRKRLSDLRLQALKDAGKKRGFGRVRSSDAGTLAYGLGRN